MPLAPLVLSKWRHWHHWFHWRHWRHSPLMAISFAVSLSNGTIGAIQMAPMASNGNRHWYQWRSPMVPMAMGCTIGAIIAITIGTNGAPMVPFSGANGANGAIGEMSDSLWRVYLTGFCDWYSILVYSIQQTTYNIHINVTNTICCEFSSIVVRI